MGQFEEQFTAAKVVTAATRPLNLYYGLCQAGMAIAAAHAEDPWSFGSHGLQLTDREGDFIDMKVRPKGSGGFQKVADATGSPVITEPVSLGALWASLPDLSESGVLPGSAHPGPLIVLADDSPARQPRASVLIHGEMPSGPAFISRFGEIMTGYPSAAGYVIPMEEGAIRPPGEPHGFWHVAVRWPAGESQQEMTGDELNAFFGEVAPEYRYRGDRFLRPAVDMARSTPPSWLMTWWLLLHNFSILARYQPRRWS